MRIKCINTYKAVRTVLSIVLGARYPTKELKEDISLTQYNVVT